MALWRAPKQHTLLEAHETPTTHFIEEFKVANRLHTSLHAERKSAAPAQVEYLQMRAKQHGYVEDARARKLPPLDKVIEHQEILGALRQDLHHAGPQAGKVNQAAETPAQLEKRLAQRDAFLASRKTRHDEAVEKFERAMDDLADECHLSAQEASKRMKEYQAESEEQVVQLLIPFEEDTEFLGERSDEEVNGIMEDLEDVIEGRRARINQFHQSLEDTDTWRKAEATKLMTALVETLTAAAHVVPGETERLVEERSLALNNALLENQKAAKIVVSKLVVQTLEKSKECKVRWHAGIQLWKQRRHHHSMKIVLERIQGNEFRQPDHLVEFFERVRDRQQQVYDRRLALVQEFFSTKVAQLKSPLVRQWEEQNNAFNDRTQDQYEALFGELKEMKDSLEIAGEGMLSSLCQELEAHDARSEWGEYTSVKDLVDGEVRPLLQECLDIVSKSLTELIDVITYLDENQHAVVVKLTAYFLGLAKKQEACKKHRDELYQVQYPGELEDTQIAHDRACETNETKMEEFKGLINDSAHHQDLDKIKEEAFEHLDAMRTEYRSHAEKMTGIHRLYPIQVHTLMQQETEAFCQDLGLVTDDVLHPEAEEGAEPKKEEEEQLPEWPESEGAEWLEGAPVPDDVGTGIKVFQRTNFEKLREQLVGPLGTAPPKTPTAEDGEEDGGAAASGEADETATVDLDEGNPRRADGEPVLLMLNFLPSWLEENLQGTCSGVFKYLVTTRINLRVEIDILGRCEEVARNLDQTLRKHTNRKGEVQVEYYVPRYSVITKHKDRFERHLIEIAKKSQDSDEKTDRLYTDVDAAEKEYQESVVALRGKLGEAESLPMLSASETKANQSCKQFIEILKELNSQLVRLAHSAPQALQTENDKYLLMCNEGKGDPYSQSECKFYTAEVMELNKTTDDRGRLRQERVTVLEERLPNMSKLPLQEFIEDYKKAVEDLCVRKGYGTEHGAPRRTAQGRCRALIALASTAKLNILDLMDHFNKLCELDSTSAEASSFKKLPKSANVNQFVLQDYFKKSGDPWVFTGEVIGNLYILTGAINNLGSHLEAFKPDMAARYKLDGLPPFRVLSEAEALIPTDAPEEVKSAELALRDQCLVQVMGSVMRADAFNAEIASIQKEAHDQYAGKGGTPDFMVTFLKEMEVSANRARQEIALSVREQGILLREENLLALGDAVYGELSARSLSEMFRCLHEVQHKMAVAWQDLNGRRANHEKLLGPRLSNPNAEQELNDLIDEEAKRYKAALTQMREDRASIVTCFREQANLFVRRLAAVFEATFKLVDAIPLAAHFSPLPGDEQVEPARMSIKRRMRRMQKGESVDQNPNSLPERAWEGVKLYELRDALRGSEWPKDKELAEATPEILAELTPGISSFRSATHKQLYERRNFYYNHYKESFLLEVTNRAMELKSREDKEQAGQTNWKSMVVQLNPEAVIPVVELEEEVEEAPPPVEDPKAKAKAKGK